MKEDYNKKDKKKNTEKQNTDMLNGVLFCCKKIIFMYLIQSAIYRETSQIKMVQVTVLTKSNAFARR